LLKTFGISVPEGRVVFSASETDKALSELGGDTWVVKAQIHAGGRGKAGGVILCRSHAEVQAAVDKLLGATLVTPQTGPQGRVVRRVYIELGCQIKQELYLSLVVDRSTGRVAVVASSSGGMDIEEVAAKSPEKIIQFSIDPAMGYQKFLGRKLAFALGISRKMHQQAVDLVNHLYHLFFDLDCNQIEINPLVVTHDNKLLILDAKISFDDNALFRHINTQNLRDPYEEDPSETEARLHDLSYVKLDGNIGCMVNGAGLAMATADLIKLHGGNPANFLDVGGSADKNRVSKAFQLILADKNVRAVFINIFGGIMHCDVIAEGIVAAAREMQLRVPMVVRLQGTNRDQGKTILERSGLKILFEERFSEAAALVVQAATSFDFPSFQKVRGI
jgi:succinyl-CoA synthetase beta subunit